MVAETDGAPSTPPELRSRIELLLDDADLHPERST
jgi:hypothetical protein